MATKDWQTSFRTDTETGEWIKQQAVAHDISINHWLNRVVKAAQAKKLGGTLTHTETWELKA